VGTLLLWAEAFLEGALVLHQDVPVRTASMARGGHCLTGLSTLPLVAVVLHTGEIIPIGTVKPSRHALTVTRLAEEVTVPFAVVKAQFCCVSVVLSKTDEVGFRGAMASITEHHFVWAGPIARR